jgi:hypothetical protein
LRFEARAATTGHDVAGALLWAARVSYTHTWGEGHLRRCGRLAQISIQRGWLGHVFHGVTSSSPPPCFQLLRHEAVFDSSWPGFWFREACVFILSAGDLFCLGRPGRLFPGAAEQQGCRGVCHSLYIILVVDSLPTNLIFPRSSFSFQPHGRGSDVFGRGLDERASVLLCLGSWYRLVNEAVLQRFQSRLCEDM